MLQRLPVIEAQIAARSKALSADGYKPQVVPAADEHYSLFYRISPQGIRQPIRVDQVEAEVLRRLIEESPEQILRNMRGIGLELRPAMAKGLLKFIASRPSLCGLESHLAVIHKEVTAFKPQSVVIDPVTSFLGVGSTPEVKAIRDPPRRDVKQESWE